MPRLYLDYQGSNKPFPRLGVLVLAAGLVVIPLVAQQYFQIRSQLDETKSTLEELERATRQTTHARQAATTATGEELLAVQEAIQHLNLPWQAMFLAIERLHGPDVALLSIEPDLSRREIKLSGEARTPAAMLEYVQQLKSQPEFGNVDLQSHQIEEEDRDKPVSFVLVAQWRAGS